MGRYLPEEQRREAILVAAKDCFVEHGFANASMADIARAAELSKGGLYFHYPSKQALMIAVVERENSRIEKALAVLSASSQPVVGQLELVLAAMGAYMRENLDAARFSQCILDEAVRSPEIHAALRRGEDLFLERLETAFRRAITEGEVPQDLDPAVAARLVMVVLEGVKTKYLQCADWPWEALLGEVRRLLLGGVLRREAV